MPYRDARPALEAKLAWLRRLREDIDADIEATEAALAASAGRTAGIGRPLAAASAVVLLVASGVLCLVAGPATSGAPPRVASARMRATSLRAAAVLFRTERPDVCPTVERLVDEGFLDGPASGWGDDCGHPFTIACSGGRVRVTSPCIGGDGRAAGDVAVPPEPVPGEP